MLEGASQSLSELISALKKAACSEDDTCLLKKFGLLCKPIQIVSRFKSNAKYFQPWAQTFRAEESVENSSLVIVHWNILVFAFIDETISIK